MRNSNFTNNESFLAGAVLEVYSSDLIEVEKCNFVKNLGGPGGVLTLKYINSLLIKECQF